MQEMLKRCSTFSRGGQDDLPLVRGLPPRWAYTTFRLQKPIEWRGWRAWPEAVVGRCSRKAWLEGVARRRGQKKGRMTWIVAPIKWCCAWSQIFWTQVRKWEVSYFLCRSLLQRGRWLRSSSLSSQALSVWLSSCSAFAAALSPGLWQTKDWRVSGCRWSRRRPT